MQLSVEGIYSGPDLGNVGCNGQIFLYWSHSIQIQGNIGTTLCFIPIDTHAGFQSTWKRTCLRNFQFLLE